ncbi:MAG: ABC transporter permease, partial [Methanoregula sp.]|nr:ABC transporter permease [Methanoregula sp.]
MDWKIFARSIIVITEKNMRIYYFKGPVVVFGLLFPLIMFLTFFIGRNLDLVLFFPGFLGMMLFFTASSVGPLITPWEKREKTYERLVSLPVILESIVIGDLLAGAIFGIAITLLVFGICAEILHLPIMNAGLLVLSFV